MDNKDEIKYTRIILADAERRALDLAALHRGRLDQLYQYEKAVEDRPNHIINPKIMRKWREEAGLTPSETT